MCADFGKVWGEGQDKYGPGENNSDFKPNHEKAGKEILVLELYQLL